MGSLMFFILMTIACVSSQELIEPLQNNQALRFEEIGQLKIINKYIKLSFNVNVASLVQLIKNASLYLTEIEGLFDDEPIYKNDIEKLRTNFYLREMELQDILHGTIQTKSKMETKKRRKRGVFPGFGGLTSEDEQAIKEDFDTINDKINEIIDVQHSVREFAKNVVTHFNRTIKEHGKRVSLDYAKLTDNSLEKKVNAMVKMLTADRLNGDIITISEFTAIIKNVTANLTDSEELPYKKAAEYYYNLPIAHKVENNIVKLEMDLPILENSTWSVYKVVELPALDGTKLYVTDVEAKFIANRTEGYGIQYMIMTSLASCLRPNKTIFYCETESPIKSISNAPSCVSTALMGGYINPKICKITSVEMPHLIFIKLNDGQYFYYTPRDEQLSIVCNAVTKTVSLGGNTTGIVNLKSGCKAVSNEYTLIKTVRYQHTTYVKQHILNISIDIDKVRENMEKYDNAIPDNYYLDSLTALREMPLKSKKVEKLGPTVYKGGSFTILQYVLIVVLSIFIVFVIYKVYIWSLQNCKGLKLNKKGTNNMVRI